ncbi:MAG: SRPBCC family protein [Solirubrobacterales bacterium]
MASWRQQVLVESPLETVWELVGDPNRYPEWAGPVVEVTGLPTLQVDSQFQQVTKDPSGTHVVNYEIEELDDEIQTIQLRCLDTHTYLRCALTEARGNTFVDMETGTDDDDEEAHTDELTRSFFIRIAEQMVEGLRRSVG